jgi:hypothetical protein
MPTLWPCLDSDPGLPYCRSSSMGPPRLRVSLSFDLSANKPSRPCPPSGFLRVGEYPANGYPLVELGLRTRGETMRPWTEAETRLLRARIREGQRGRNCENPRPPCWFSKKEGQRIRLDPNKEGKG